MNKIERTRATVEQLAAQIRALARGEQLYGGAREPGKVRGRSVAASSPKKPRETTKRPRKPEPFLTAPLEEPTKDPVVELWKKGRQAFLPHEGSPTVIGEGELATFEEVTVGPISAYGTSAATEALASMGPVDFKPKTGVDPVIRATAAFVEEQRAHTFALQKAIAESAKKGNWKRQCQARDAENGLQCGQLEGHERASARYPATKHKHARGEFVRVLQAGQEPSTRRELERWAQDRRDVGDVSP